MAFDGFVIRALVKELAEKLTANRIHKIYQPHQTDLVINFRGYGKNLSLMLSANPTYPRINLTDKNYVNPIEPPMFCMLLRKHLEGGIIENIYQVDLERIIHIDIKTKDELGDIQTKRLIIEIMGRHSNIILVNPDSNKIIDGINHVTSAISGYRQVLPGREYIDPPKQNKLNPLLVTKDIFFTYIKLNEGKIDNQLVENFTGMSPALAKEILNLAGLPTNDNVWNSFYTLMEKIKQDKIEPSIVIGKDKTDFSIIPLTHLTGKIINYEDINMCIDHYYEQKAERDIVRQKTQDLAKYLLNEKKKNEKKINNLLQDLEDAKKADKYKLYGELLTASLHLVKRGDKEVTVINYYDDDQSSLTITLDPLITPVENAQAFFKKYNKLKTSKEFINEQIKKTQTEINYLDTILTQIDNASMGDIDDIREELIEEGYFKKQRKQYRRKKSKPEIEKFTSSTGVPIYVGKNNRQNEYLTHQLAAVSDTWLHTKNIPGSHVIIKTKEFDDNTLIEAAKLAAYFSKAKHSSNVPVDYTLVKYVKKPSGAKPGFVIYDNQKTLYVTPDIALIENLRENKE